MRHRHDVTHRSRRTARLTEGEPSNPVTCPPPLSVVRYFAGTLGEEDRTDLREHFARCSNCWTEVQALRQAFLVGVRVGEWEFVD
jgi:Putative zinc-finger